MSILFLTSNIDCYYKDENGERHPQTFSNTNNLIDNFKKYIKKYDNFVYVASTMKNEEMTDFYSQKIIESFKMTLPFKNYFVLDHRKKNRAEEIIKNADFIFLCGGHIPSQLELFEELNLREIIKTTQAVICGMSAGSMNSAEMVYCPPELEGEAVDKDFKRYRKGLGLTNINIYPHWNENLKDIEFLDGQNMYKDIMLADSKIKPFICFDDGTYILQVDDKAKLFGNAFIFKNGEYTKYVQQEELTY